MRVKPSICFVVITLPCSAAGCYLSHTHTHTQTYPSFLHKELHIFLPKISLKTHFSPYIYIYIYKFFFCLCKFVVRALFVLVRSSEKNPLPPFAVPFAAHSQRLPVGFILLPVPKWGPQSGAGTGGLQRAKRGAPIQLAASSTYFGGSPVCSPRRCPSPQVPPGFGCSCQALIFFSFSNEFKSPS